MGYLAAWFQERPRVIEAVQLASPAAVVDIAEFVGARSWDPSEVDVEFYATACGTLTVGWGEWVVRLHAVQFEVVPAALFIVMYEPVVS